MLLSTYYKESNALGARAEIHETRQGFVIEFYAPDGSKIQTQSYEGKSIHFVQDVAENWISGLKTLNG